MSIAVIENFLVSNRFPTTERRAEAPERPVQAAPSADALADAALLHEIRNALAAVLGHAELMPMLDDLNADASSSLRQIVVGARRALDLANSRRTAAAAAVTRSTSRPAAIVSEVVEGLRPMCRGRVSIEVTNTQSLPQVACPADRLHQVLSNLVKNAIEALGTSNGTIRISLRPSRCAMERGNGVDAVEFVVADDGPGMSSEVRARIFEPFFTTKAENGGTGVGLSVVQSIVRQHGGYVNCASRPGAGTVFRIVLPAVVEV